jgi:hypothetical protein
VTRPLRFSGRWARTTVSRSRAECPFRWTTPEYCGVRTLPVWLNGLEPPTPRSRTGCSVQTELQPGECRMTPAGCASRGSPETWMKSPSLDQRSERRTVRAERVELSRACAHRISESGASSISATPARWTQPGSNRHASRCKRGALPLVLWAEGPGGSNRTTAGTMPRGLQPRSSNQQRSPGRDRSVWRRRIDVPPIPNLAYYLVVNVRKFIRHLGKKGKASPSRGGRSRTHVRRVGAGCPFRWTTPLRVVWLFSCAIGPGIQTSRPLPEAAPQRTGRMSVLVMPLRAPPGGRSQPN